MHTLVIHPLDFTQHWIQTQSQKSFQTAAICSKTKVIVQETVHHIQENNISWLGVDADRLPGFVCARLPKPALRTFDKVLFSSFALFP